MKQTPVFLLILFGLILMGCNPEFKEVDKYARPDWLVGKVYTQLKDQPELSTFAECLELSGYDTIIDISGSYTVFAPDNEAFSSWFQSHPTYNSVGDIPIPELTEIVKYHILQNPWTKNQLKTLDVYGWIDTLDLNNNKPRGFKRQTLLLDSNRKLGVVQMQDKSLQIVDTLESSWQRVIATDSRKYVPIFFKEYFDIYDLDAGDYQFYFNRPIESSEDLFYAGGKVLGDEIFAENGFVYIIDRVIEPLPNAYQILEEGTTEHQYTDFLDLINLFPEFAYNEEKTFDQPGADQGFQVDSLFDLNYPRLAFDFLNERTSAPPGTFGLPSNVTIRYHHGMVVPTNTAFADFERDYMEGASRWGTVQESPSIIKRIIANTHLSFNPIYPTDFENGYYNGELDLITLDQGSLVHTQYGSNSSFIGTSSAVVPRIFESVAGPSYLFRGYSKTMFAIEEAGLSSALKRENENYLFFMESNVNSSTDSSLLASGSEFSLWQIAEGGFAREFGLSTPSLRTLLLNHIATGIPTGIPRKEFFKNLAANYIIFNNETGEVRGTGTTSVGYQGSKQQPNFPTQFNTEAYNGITYDIENYFSFTATSIYQTIQSNFPVFHDLLAQAGLANSFELRYPFLSENEDYTVFVPNDSVLTAYMADTLEREVLQNFLKLHFVQGDLIFTDGKKQAGYYETSRIDEASTSFTTIFSRIYVDPGIDVINIGDAQSGVYVSAVESDNTNIMTGMDVGEGTEVFRNLIINGVIHEIDRVLVFEDLDTN